MQMDTHKKEARKKKYSSSEQLSWKVCVKKENKDKF